MSLDKNKRVALLVTLLFHVVVVIALLFMALRTPLPLPGEEGVEVNLGVSDAGAGMRPVQPKIVKPEPKTEKKVEKKTPAPQPKPEPVPAKTVTQNTESAPALEKKKPVAPKTPKKKVIKKEKVLPKPVVKKPKAEVKKESPKESTRPVVNKRALFKVPVGDKTQGQGDKKGSNDQGKMRGDKTSQSYSGKGGQGHGISFSLGDRGALYLDKPSSNFTEQGAVVVKIWVNPKGKVVKAVVYAKGTTVVDDSLRKMAVAAARNSSFSSDPTAPSEQIGTITYHFILKK